MSNDGCDCSNSLHFSVNAAAPQVALRGRFIRTLTEKSIANQNMRVQGYDRAAKDENGSKELVDLRIEIYFYCIL